MPLQLINILNVKFSIFQFIPQFSMCNFSQNHDRILFFLDFISSILLLSTFTTLLWKIEKCLYPFSPSTLSKEYFLWTCLLSLICCILENTFIHMMNEQTSSIQLNVKHSMRFEFMFILKETSCTPFLNCF